MAKAARAATRQDDAPVTIWQAQDGPQTALIACPVFEVFFGGARGGGKTDGVLGDFLEHADAYGEHAIGLMVRRERTQLIETIERSRQVYTALGWKFHEQEKMWRAPNGARLRFAYLERDSDAEAYQGHSYTRVYVEEIGTFPRPEPVLKLMATLRSGAGVPVGFRATGNPGGPGHQWVKARYIDPAPMGWKIITDTYKNPWAGDTVTRDRVYIPSRLNDNQYLGSDYVANLQMSGNATLVRAWLEGDWSVIEGAFFPEWSSDKHVIPPFAIPSDWLRFRSADWGSAAPFSIGWWAVVGDDFEINRDGFHYGRRPGSYGEGPSGAEERGGNLVLPRGAIIRYREWYGASAPNVGLKLPAEQVAEKIKALETQTARSVTACWTPPRSRLMAARPLLSGYHVTAPTSGQRTMPVYRSAAPWAAGISCGHACLAMVSGQGFTSSRPARTQSGPFQRFSMIAAGQRMLIPKARTTRLTRSGTPACHGHMCRRSRARRSRPS
jgi:hypothetical protein